jgi:hypothetical protein
MSQIDFRNFTIRELTVPAESFADYTDHVNATTFGVSGEAAGYLCMMGTVTIPLKVERFYRRVIPRRGVYHRQRPNWQGHPSLFIVAKPML